MLPKLESFSLGSPQSTLEWVVSGLAIILTFAFLVLVYLFVKHAGKGTIHFVRESLSDPTGRGDIKYLLAAVIVLFAFLPTIVFGFVTGKWAPEYVIWAIIVAFTTLAGVSVIDFKNAMKSGVAIMKPDPPKEILVKTNPEEPIIPAQPTSTDTDFVLKK